MAVFGSFKRGRRINLTDGQKNDRQEGQSEGQMDRWVTYLFHKTSDRQSSEQTGRQMYKLGRETYGHVGTDRDSMPKNSGTGGTGRPDTSL